MKTDTATNQEKIFVRGGARLKGEVKITGAKNAVLKQMAACAMIPAEVVLTNVPPLRDVIHMMKILQFVGGKCSYDEQAETMTIDFSELGGSYVPFELATKLRASFVILGPLLARLGTAKVSLPGGCQIGTRRLDLHEKGLRKMGVDLDVSHGYIEAEAVDGRLKGAEILLDIPSNGATENLMMAAVLAEGNTVIDNAARDPEIEDLANFLISCGARIEGAGSSRMIIEGVNLNELHGCRHDVIPDRIEAGTFLLAGLATGGCVTVSRVNPRHLVSLVSKLAEMGAELTQTENTMTAYAPGKLKGVEVSTLWYPGFPTDMQPQLSSVLSISEGTSIIKETIYEDRFSHIQELMRMGAEVQVSHGVAVMQGTERLSGARVKGGDLRATAGLIIAGLTAEGITEVEGLNHLDRGYADFSGKLARLGAQINRVQA